MLTFKSNSKVEGIAMKKKLKLSSIIVSQLVIIVGIALIQHTMNY